MNWVVHRFFFCFARFVLFFEPISPRFISFWLRRRLKEWKRKGFIDSYRIKTQRIGKFHYRIDIDLDLMPRQASSMLEDTLIRILRRIGR